MRTLITILLLAAQTFAQTRDAAPRQLLTVANVGALPSACTQGMEAFVASATAGQQIYECSSLGVWTQENDAGRANTALSNLSGVSINTNLTPQLGVDGGSATNPFRNFYLYGSGTFATTSLKLTGTPTANRVITIPDVTAKLLTTVDFPTAQSFIFSQIPGGTLTGAVQATVTLTPCPLGVNGADVRHQLYVSAGTGTAEAVTITGGTCTSGATTGTIIFTPANNHSGAWAIQSASGGIEEASSWLGGTGGVLLPIGTTAIYATMVLPTTLSLMGSGATTSAGTTGTVLSCVVAANPCIVVADNLGTAAGQGMGIHRAYNLYGAGSGVGLWIGGDPANVFAPSTWTGSYTSYQSIFVSNFTTTLEIQGGNFVSFVNSSFSGLTRALIVPSTNVSNLQPVEFYGCVLSVPSGSAVQMDSNGFVANAIHFIGGQVSGTITGLGVGWESDGTHYEPNSTNTAVLSVTATSGHRVRISGGIISFHGTALTSGINMSGSGQYYLNVENAWVQDDVGMTITNFINYNTSSGGKFSACNNSIAAAGAFTNLYTVNTVGGFPDLKLCQNIGYASNAPTATAGATLTFPALDFPVSQKFLITGATVGGMGIATVAGPIYPAQSGVLVTANIQTFTAGATIGNTGTTVAGLPYTYYFDATKLWVYGKGF